MDPVRRSELLDNWDRAQTPAPLLPTEPRSITCVHLTRPARVVEVEAFGDFRLRLTFSDDLVRELDFDGVLEGGVFAPLSDQTLFR
jgi:hypothetical protein